MVTANWVDYGIMVSKDGTDVLWVAASDAELLIDRIRELLDAHPGEGD